MNKIVQDYILLDSIGKGQYGNVYKSQNRKNKQIFAIKVMNVEKFKHTPKLKEFTNNEISILSRINHINIIKFVDILRTANNYYLVYEFCNGGTLAEYIHEKKRLSEQEAIKIFLQLRSAFEALYSENILHRDLKPTNILFHNGVIKIADFGFCKELLKETDMTQTMVGSPIYMAPEVLKGLIYDNRADIWSLGVILYEMLYGVCPYQESSIPQLISLLDHSTLKFPPDVEISENLKIFLRRILTIKSRDRISANEFIQYPLGEKKEEKRKVDLSPKLTTFKDVSRFIRKNLGYLADSLEILTGHSEDLNCLKLAYLLFKMVNAIQKDTGRSSLYWEMIRIPNTDERWEIIYQSEMASLKTVGEIVKQALHYMDNSIKMKAEFETHYIDSKYYLEMTEQIKEIQLRNRLYNCLLIYKHFIQALDKKALDFTDYINGNKTIAEKEHICKNFAKRY